MPHGMEHRLIDPLLDSWDRSNTILVNLLRAVPDEAMDARTTAESPSIGQLFMHIHYVRLVFVLEDAPDFAGPLPEGEWGFERDRERMAQLLNESAKTVRLAVGQALEFGRDMKLHYDHPLLMLQHMIWHEGYHHGQIKVALKVAGRAIPDDQAGPLTWDVWMNKRNTNPDAPTT